MILSNGASRNHIASDPMNRTISPATAFISIAAMGALLIGGITVARQASADANARECVAQGFNAGQCWSDQQPSF